MRKSRRGARQTRAKAVTKTPIRGFLSQHSVALLSLALTLVASFVIYYLAYGEPDIRFVPSWETGQGPPNLTDDKGNCYYFHTSKTRFRNLSFKKGFINDVKLSPVTTDTIAEFKLISIDKSPIRWGEEKEVEIKFGISLTPAYCERISDTGIKFKSVIYYYDNAGNQLTKDVNGEPYTEEFNFQLISNPNRNRSGSSIPAFKETPTPIP